MPSDVVPFAIEKVAEESFQNHPDLEMRTTIISASRTYVHLLKRENYNKKESSELVLGGSMATNYNF